MKSAISETQFSRQYVQERIASVPRWWHSIEVAPGIFTPGVDDSGSRLHQMGFPERMDGKTVLDIGAHDGFFSFECERRGAEVTAVDVLSPEESGFAVAHELLQSKVKHIRKSIYNLDPEELGQFDIVLCLGVLYHLRHPLLGLDRIYSVCKDLLIIESQICDSWFVREDRTPVMLDSISPDLRRIPIAQFYPGDELNNDPSNWWSPNEIALQKMLEISGFEPRRVYSDGVRAVFHSWRVKRSPWVEADVREERKNLRDAREKTRTPEEMSLSKQLQATREDLRATRETLRAIENSLTLRVGSATQEELRITRQRLQAIEPSLTWQIGQKLAYSWPGRALHYLISRLRR